MNLRRRVFYIILIASGIMLVALTGFVVLLVYSNSAALDEQLADANSTRVQRAIQDELTKLTNTGVAWGYWTDANDFVKTKSQDFINNELTEDSLNSTGIQVIIYVDKNHNIIYSNYIDPLTGVANPAPQGLIQYLFTNKELYAQKSLTDKILGVLALPEGPFLVSSMNTLNSDSSGPSNGYLIVAKPLDKKTLSEIGFVTGLSLEGYPYSSSSMPVDVNASKQALSSGKPFTLSQLGGGNAAAYILFKDLQTQPAAILKIIFPSTVYSQTTNILKFLLPALIIIAIGYGLTITRLMNQYVVNPLTTLDNDLDSINNSHETGKRVVETGDKEIRSLSASINDLISSNEKSTTDLKRSLNQLLTIAEINRSISGYLDPQRLLQEVADLLQNRLGLYYVGIFLLDANKEFAELKAGTGEAGKEMLSRGHKLAVGGVSMIGWSTATQKSRIALDVGKDAIRFSNPLLPDTRSELAIPIVSRNVTVGALSLQSNRETAFNENDIIAFQGIADSLSVALENATLFQNARENLDEIRSLNRIYVQRSWGSEVIIPGALEYTYEEKSSKRSKRKTTMLEIPLLLRDQPVGGLSLEIPEGTLTPDDRAIIMAIADQTAQALENVRLLQETQERALREEKINELVMKFSGAGSIDEIMKLAAQEIGNLSSISEVNVHLIPELSSSKGDHIEDASSNLEVIE